MTSADRPAAPSPSQADDRWALWAATGAAHDDNARLRSRILVILAVATFASLGVATFLIG